MAADNTHRTPRVFISSTVKDLTEHWLAVERAASKAGFLAQPCEDWEASPKQPLSNCLERVDQCHVLVAILADWHGWTPDDPGNTEHKSITRLECERAALNGYAVIPFLLDPEFNTWPLEHRESYRMTEAMDRDLTEEQLLALQREVKRNRNALDDFRTWLQTDRTRNLFTSPGDLEEKLGRALRTWLDENPAFRPAQKAAGFDAAAYLDWVRRQCESVELLGIDQREANNVRLQQVYVPARVAAERDEAADRERPWALLIDRIGAASLYVPGAPGAGKSTFCRWLALILAAGEVPPHPVAVPDEYTERFPAALKGRLPILCYLRDLNDHRSLLRGGGRWLRCELEQALANWFDKTQPGGLTGSAWRALLEQGSCLLILDGVDELQASFEENGQRHRPRANLLSGLADALPHWQPQGNRLLLTSRPYGLGVADRRKLGLAAAELEPLDDALQQVFIRRWYAAVDPAQAELKGDGLIAHLAERDDLRMLEDSPMLLTALCVRYDEGRRLPRDIHALYHAIINQVLHGRYPDPVEQQAVRRRLAAVALAMHTGTAIGQTRRSPEAAVGYHELDAILTDYAGQERASEVGTTDAAAKRQDLISCSGLLLPRGDEQAGFYHLSFQEFLAAERLDILHRDLASYLRRCAAIPEWHRTLVFLFCAVAEDRPQVALDALREVLLPYLSLKALAEDPNPAELLLDCLDIAQARRLTLTEFTDDLARSCEASLQAELEPTVRNRIWLAAGRLGADRRPGVGVTDGIPDIAWCEVPAGPVILEHGAGEYAVGAFSMARYPVTHGQFKACVDAVDGYRNPAW